MPELPEVETIRRGLEQQIIGKTMVDVNVRLPKIFKGDQKLLLKGKISAIRRFGKGLVVDLDNGYSLAVHVKMTGQLVFVKSGESDLPNKWTHVIIKLAEHAPDTLFFSDQRQFGWMQVVKTEEVLQMPFFKSLGPEPLRDLDLITFEKIIASSRAPIKSLLMNQQKIAGLGNIYVNDALYLAKIHPKRPPNQLTKEEKAQLLQAIETVLQRSLAVGGASSKNYINAFGEQGAYQKSFLVYRKQGKPCSNCGTEISMMRIAGRSTFYCSHCQK